MRGKTYRRFRTEFKLVAVEAYLAAEGGLEGLATKAGVDHSLVRYWLKKHHAGELSLDLRKTGLIAAPATSSGRSVIISGPAVSTSITPCRSTRPRRSSKRGGVSTMRTALRIN